MKIVSLNDNLQNAIAARPVYDEYMTLLVNAGTPLDPALIAKLKGRGFKYIYIKEKGTEDVVVAPTFSIDAGRQVANEIRHTFQKVQSLSSGDKTTLNAVFNRLPLEDRFANLLPKGSLRMNVKKLVKDIYYRNLSSVNSYTLSMLGTNPLSHAMDATILSILLGKRFHYTLNELGSLAAAALLHDCGMQLFPDICDKPFFIMDDEEKVVYYKHPGMGFQLLDCLNCFPAVETRTVHQHHENQDGTGFPNGYSGNNDKPLKVRRPEKGRIFRWAEILAVADRYVQYCTGHLTPLPLPPIDAIAAVIEDSETVLNSEVVSELVKLVNIFPVGAPVKIADSLNREIIGFEGVVVKENPGDNNLPNVLLLKTRKGRRIVPKRFDLSQDKTAKLTLAI